MLLNNTAATPTLYDYDFNGVSCDALIRSDYNVNKCMSSMITDNGVTDANIPANCKALLI
jgi:hypothetical protein